MNSHIRLSLKSNFVKIRSRGFTLIEMAIVLMIAGLMSISVANMARDAAKDAKATTIANHLKVIKGGVDAYISSNYQALISATPIIGFAAPMLPTVAELKAGGFLGQNINAVNAAGSTWVVQIVKFPAACIAPACDLNAIVYSNVGLKTAAGTPDSYMAALVAGKLGGDGGVSLDTNPSIISGERGLWSSPNPVPVLNRNAVVAMRTGYNSQGLSQFVRQGDSRNIILNGALVVNGVSGVNATKIAAATSTFGTSTIGTLNATTGNIATVNAGTVSTTGTVTAGGGVLTGQMVAGAACSPNGLIKTAADGALYSCQAGVWVSSSTKPCVHGNYISSTPGSATLTIPLSCQTFAVSVVGAGSDGADAYYELGPNCPGWDCYSTGAGGSSGVGMTNIILKNTTGSYGVTVGASGRAGGDTYITDGFARIISAAGGRDVYQYWNGGVSKVSEPSASSGINSVSGGVGCFMGNNLLGWLVTNWCQPNGGVGGGSILAAGGMGAIYKPNTNAIPAQPGIYGSGGGGGGINVAVVGTGIYRHTSYTFTPGASGGNGYVQINW